MDLSDFHGSIPEEVLVRSRLVRRSGRPSSRFALGTPTPPDETGGRRRLDSWPVAWAAGALKGDE